MDASHTKLGVLAIFAPDADRSALLEKLLEAGVEKESINWLSPVSLTPPHEEVSDRFWPYAITMVAGLVGIAVGIFFAAGTAAMYPLMTGGKPIVAAPIVGIISYETMMLLAILATFLTMIVRIRRAQRATVDREAGIDNGKLALSLRLTDESREPAVRRLLELAGAEDVRLVSQPPLPRRERTSQALATVLLLYLGMGGCSPDMQEQPSYRSQESPRLHSPSGSIPRESRTLVSRQALADSRLQDSGKELYRVNCLPCHGSGGEGTGPVAPYLTELPANLRAARVQSLSKEQLYNIITNGKDTMPSFKGELSATERMIIASFIQTMGGDVARPLQ